MSKVPHLSDLDADQNFPSQSNFKYYSVHDFHVDEEIKNLSSSDSFSVLHCNIRSLAANCDKRSYLLSDLKYSFSVIGISETRIKVDQ